MAFVSAGQAARNRSKDTKALLEGDGGDDPNPLPAEKATVLVGAVVRRRRMVGNRRGISIMVGVWFVCGTSM